MDPHASGFGTRWKPAYTLTILATLTLGILIGTVISKGVRGQESKKSSARRSSFNASISAPIVA